jgi:F-type H+-transporting ATPase subunit gamma
MASGREIRTKINSVKSTQKITKAMEMVAASKMRKAQQRMQAGIPYWKRVRAVLRHLHYASTEYRHEFLVQRDPVKAVGLIVITSDKGLCGGLNINVLRTVVKRMKQWRDAGIEVEVCAIGGKGLGFLQRVGANIVSYVRGIGDTPHLERLAPALTVLFRDYLDGKIDQIHICGSVFINTMTQKPIIGQIVPIKDNAEEIAAQLGIPTSEWLKGVVFEDEATTEEGHWDYIYEPNAPMIIDRLLRRALESVLYQAVAEHIACEMSARMVAMKAASENAQELIGELTLLYNKNRQAAITQELAEISAGAAAV